MDPERTFQRFAYVLDAALVVLLLLVSVHPYQWMRDLDPTMAQLPDDPIRDVRIIATLAALLVVLAVHGLCIARNRDTRVRLLNLLLAAGLTALTAWRLLR